MTPEEERIASKAAAEAAAQVATKTLTRAEARQIAREAAHEVLYELGIDSADFHGKEDFRDTIQWASDARRGSEAVRINVKRGFFVAVGTGLAYFVWQLFHALIKVKG